MSTNSASGRIVYHDNFDSKGFTNENSLVNAYLTKPDTIDPVMTHLMGKESDKFPLSFLSEGQKGGTEVKDVQYEWDAIGRLTKADVVISSTYTAGSNPGISMTNFTVTFKTSWLKVQHLIESENGTVAVVVSRPVQNGLYWDYTLQLAGSDLSASCPLQDLVPGTKWAMNGGAPVAQSLSMGNESNVVTPGKLRNQLSFLRKSFRIAGNISNKTVEVMFDIDGKKTNLWMNWEQWQHNLAWKESIEEHLWYSKYNRDANGRIYLKDQSTGLPIPIGAGVLDQIPNHDTYSFLTAKKLKNTVRDVMFGATDTGKMDVVLFTGLGGMEEFDNAMKADAATSGFNAVQGDKFITGAGRNLVLGGYFTQYQHIDGHVITVKQLPMLDHGGRAEAARRHPITGLPITSYDMYFVDMSTYDGKRNVTLCHEKGRSMITGVMKGMAATPANFGGNNVNVNLATERDESSVHYMCSKGICIRRNTHCFVLTCGLS